MNSHLQYITHIADNTNTKAQHAAAVTQLNALANQLQQVVRRYRL